METRKTKSTRKASKGKNPAKAKKEVPKIALNSWFANKVRDKKLNPWQEKEIQVFFKSRGLSDIEEPEKYEENLKLY